MLLYTFLLLTLSLVSADRCGWAGQTYLWSKDKSDECDAMHDDFVNKRTHSFVSGFDSSYAAPGVVLRTLNPGFTFKNSVDWFDQLALSDIVELDYACTGVVYSSSVGYSTSLENVRDYSVYIDFHFLSRRNGHAVVVNGVAQQVCELCNVAFTIELPLIGKSVVSLYLMNFYPGLPNLFQRRRSNQVFGSGPNVFVDPYVRDNTWSLSDQERKSASVVGLHWDDKFNMGLNKATELEGDAWTFWNEHMHDGVYGGFQRFDDIDARSIHRNVDHYATSHDLTQKLYELQDTDFQESISDFTYNYDTYTPGYFLESLIDTPIFQLSPSLYFTENDWMSFHPLHFGPTSLYNAKSDISSFGSVETDYNYDGDWWDSYSRDPIELHTYHEDNWSELEHQWCRVARWTTLFNPIDGRDWFVFDEPIIDALSHTVTVDISTGLGVTGVLEFNLQDTGCVVDHKDPEEFGTQYGVAVGNPCSLDVYQSAAILPYGSNRAYALCIERGTNDGVGVIAKAPMNLDLTRLGTEMGCANHMSFPEAIIACENLGDGWHVIRLSDINDRLNCEERCVNPFGLFWAQLEFPLLPVGSITEEIVSADGVYLVENASHKVLPAQLLMDEVTRSATFALPPDCDVFSLNVIFRDLENMQSEHLRTVTKWRLAGAKGFDIKIFEVLTRDWGPGMFSDGGIASRSDFTKGSSEQINRSPFILQGRVLYKQLNFWSPQYNFPTYGIGFQRDMLTSGFTPVVSFTGSIINFQRFDGSCEFRTYSQSTSLVRGSFLSNRPANSHEVPGFNLFSKECNHTDYNCHTSGLIKFLDLFEFLYSSKVADPDHFSLHWTCYGSDSHVGSSWDTGTSRAFNVRASAMLSVDHDPDNQNLVHYMPVVSSLFFRPVVLNYGGFAILNTDVDGLVNLPGTIVLSAPVSGHVYCYVSTGPIVLLGSPSSVGWEDRGNGLINVFVALTLHSPGSFPVEVTCVNSNSSPENFLISDDHVSDILIKSNVVHPGYARILVGYTGIVQKWQTDNKFGSLHHLRHPLVTGRNNVFIFRLKHSDNDFTLPSTSVEVRLNGLVDGVDRLPVVVGVQVNWGNDVVGVWQPNNGEHGVSAYVSTKLESDSGLEMIATARGWEISAPDGFNVVISKSYDCKFIDVKIDVSLGVLEAACDNSEGHYCFGAFEIDEDFRSTLFGYPSGTNDIHSPYDTDRLPRWDAIVSHVPARTSFPNAVATPISTDNEGSIIGDLSNTPASIVWEIHPDDDSDIIGACGIDKFALRMIKSGLSICSNAFPTWGFCILFNKFHQQLRRVCIFLSLYQVHLSENEFAVGEHLSGYHYTVIYYFFEFMFKSGFLPNQHEVYFKGAIDAVNANVLFCGDRSEFSDDTGMECICRDGLSECLPECFDDTAVEIIPSGLDRSAVVNSVTGEAWRMYRSSLYYFTVTANWVPLPPSEVWPVVLDSFSCDNAACSSVTHLVGRTELGVSVISNDKGSSWHPSGIVIGDKEVSFSAHHSSGIVIDGLGRDVWWLTEKHLCVLSNRLVTESKPLEYCVSWWCDCIDEGDWNSQL